MAQQNKLKVAVVGTGVFGTWISHQLQRAGCGATLFDQYGPANARSSSGGESRLLRAGYGPSRLYSDARFPAIEGKTWNHPVLVGDRLLVLPTHRRTDEPGSHHHRHPRQRPGDGRVPVVPLAPLMGDFALSAMQDQSLAILKIARNRVRRSSVRLRSSSAKLGSPVRPGFETPNSDGSPSWTHLEILPHKSPYARTEVGTLFLSRPKA